MHHILINTSFCSRLITFINIAMASLNLTSFSHTFPFSEHTQGSFGATVAFICDKNKTGHSVLSALINNHYYKFSPASGLVQCRLRV